MEYEIKEYSCCVFVEGHYYLIYKQYDGPKEVYSYYKLVIDRYGEYTEDLLDVEDDKVKKLLKSIAAKY
jgi:hypothetical protein